jgi:hypothetical protein
MNLERLLKGRLAITNIGEAEARLLVIELKDGEHRIQSQSHVA